MKHILIVALFVTVAGCGEDSPISLDSTVPFDAVDASSTVEIISEDSLLGDSFPISPSGDAGMDSTTDR